MSLLALVERVAPIELPRLDGGIMLLLGPRFVVSIRLAKQAGSAEGRKIGEGLRSRRSVEPVDQVVEVCSNAASAAFSGALAWMFPVTLRCLATPLILPGFQRSSLLRRSPAFDLRLPGRAPRAERLEVRERFFDTIVVEVVYQLMELVLDHHVTPGASLQPKEQGAARSTGCSSGSLASCIRPAPAIPRTAYP